LEYVVANAFPKALGAEVRARRTSLRLNQQDLADMAGVSERFVRFVEQGKPSIQLDSLLAVLETLGMELKLGTRSREAAHALVRGPLQGVPPSAVPPESVPPESAESGDGGDGGRRDNRP
jgi:y4mF family transcriptional regulator